MTIALLNTTPIIHKIVDRLAQNRGDMLYQDLPDDAALCDVVIVDDSVAAEFNAATARRIGRFTLYCGSRFDPMPEGYDAILPKPFLPDELNRVLDDAELSLSAAVDRNDIFDADEAAGFIESETEGPVFNHEEVEAVKQLLDAFDTEMETGDVYDQVLGKDLEEAVKGMEENEWDQPVEEVLYDAEAEAARQPQSEPEPEPEFEPEPEATDDYGDIDLHARGVEALQDLMAILSDQSVAQALKSIGVRIEISFGEKA